MAEPEEIKLEVDMQGKECSFVSFTVRDGVFLERNSNLLRLKRGSSEATFKNPTSGVVRLNTAYRRGDPIKNGDVVAWRIGDCNHIIIFRNTCADCGKNMEGTSFIREKQEGLAQYVSSVHNKPELVVSLDKARQLSMDNQQQLLNHRKLILLVDLDQTLIHTTDKPPRPNEVNQDVHGFQLSRVHYYTKIRPHTFDFLQNISKLFELHIVTYGQRVYAEKIVQLLDRDRKLFASRILSRDELISANSKSVNMQALFPSGSQLVMMIDDRADVWENSDSLIWVKPYRYFTEVGDINAINVQKNPDSSIDDEAGCEADEMFEIDKLAAEAPNDDQMPESSNGQQPGSNAENLPEQPPDNESDDILVNVERTLANIHGAFFDQYETDKKIRPVSEFAADLRKKVLQDEFIVFSGVVRLGVDPKTHPIYHCCVRFGAIIQEEINEQTTTLIAVKAQTEKYYAAKKRGIPIVTVKWIEECMALWEKVNKKQFALQAPSKYELAINNTLSHMDRLTSTDLSNMQHEIDQELGGLSESSHDEDDLPPPEKVQRVCE